MISTEAVAAISGGAAVLGAVAGGGVAGWANLRGQKSRQDFDREERLAIQDGEKEQRAALVRGEAREMRSQFKRNLDILRTHSGGGFWWNDQVPNPELFGREDGRVLIASEATADQWAAIEFAEHQLRRVEGWRRLTTERAARLISEAHERGETESLSVLDFGWFGTEPDSVEEHRQNARNHLATAITATEAAITGLDLLSK
jgi:hypothetical protein